VSEPKAEPKQPEPSKSKSEESNAVKALTKRLDHMEKALARHGIIVHHE
jgi:hypothetical protein